MKRSSVSQIIISAFLALIIFTLSVDATPWVISHRGGGQKYPENTLFAFSKSIEMGCDALELDVQVTKDGVVVVYHPEDLKQWTNGVGPIAEKTWGEIATLDAGYQFQAEKGYPYRNQYLGVPKLEDVLEAFPKAFIIVDMKSLPAEALVKALIKTVSDEETVRMIFYSTNAEHIDLLNQYKPFWRTFEKRDFTRQRLLDINQTGLTNLPISSPWMGFELKRKMVVTETFALGKGTSSVEFRLWTPSVVAYLRQVCPDSFLVLFGINKKEDWDEAVSLGVNAIYTDNPAEIIKFKTLESNPKSSK